MAWWLLATALEHIPEGNCITIGESGKGSIRRKSIRYEEKREGIAEMDSIYIYIYIYICI